MSITKKEKRLAKRGLAVLVALLAMNGCGAESAESGSDDHGTSGSTSQAITVASGDALSVALKDAPACTVQDDNGVKYAMIATGADAMGNASKVINLFKTNAAGGSQRVLTTALSGSAAARVHARMSTDPGNVHRCTLVGGDNGSGTPIANANRSVVSLTLSGHLTPSNTLAIAEADESSGFTPVFQTSLAVCGTKLIAVGGGTSASAETRVSQFWKGAGSGWASISNAITTARKDAEIAVASDGTKLRFIVSGGFNNTSQELQSVELLKYSTSTFTCDTVTQAQIATAALANARRGAVAFETAYDGTNDASTFLVGAGDDGTTTYATSDVFRVSWSGTPSQLDSRSSGPSLPTAVHHPGFVITSTGLPVIAGGSNHAGAAQTLLVKYVGGAFFSSTSGTLAARIFPALAESESLQVAAMGGDNGGALSTMDIISTP